ncbi:hypothetical protein AB0395_21840 [Streptosporangium sp. NPDC051023]|uniref:hypothetical protein n=1 Tax=Streptosporangium sp. NPDC051023 TaxID=3155410 RepID=UPI00344D6878
MTTPSAPEPHPETSWVDQLLTMTAQHPDRRVRAARHSTILLGAEQRAAEKATGR